MGPGMFDGIGTIINVLLVTCAIAVPLGLWKLVDIIIWCIHHIDIAIK